MVVVCGKQNGKRKKKQRRHLLPLCNGTLGSQGRQLHPCPRRQWGHALAALIRLPPLRSTHVCAFCTVYNVPASSTTCQNISTPFPPVADTRRLPVHPITTTSLQTQTCRQRCAAHRTWHNAQHHLASPRPLPSCPAQPPLPSAAIVQRTRPAPASRNGRMLPKTTGPPLCTNGVFTSPPFRNQPCTDWLSNRKRCFSPLRGECHRATRVALCSGYVPM
ncbi:uncharacterized protein BKA78DRAFT_125992 [Phyllosticta capitalensis]|uniref:uncharacterized protein n=1 Tax=Phyllosticta capitalensis TaxID=121624 RepID=UPI00312F7535